MDGRFLVSFICLLCLMVILTYITFLKEISRFKFPLLLYFWFKYGIGHKYYAPQFRPDNGSNSWPPHHCSTFHVTEMLTLTTQPTVIKYGTFLFWIALMQILSVCHLNTFTAVSMLLFFCPFTLWQGNYMCILSWTGTMHS